MSNRIPHSLSWLIKKRSEILGEIISAQKKLDQHVNDEELRIRKLKTDLRSLDGTIRLHHIKLDPKVIEPTRPCNTKRFLPHGGYTQLIFELLREAHPLPLSTDYLAHRLLEASNFENTFEQARQTIKDRMRTLCRQGFVLSAHLNKQERHAQKGLWTLNPDRVQNTKKLVNSDLPTTFLALPVTEPPA